MSITNSNLQSVGYDMVVGLTQNSMNATMKRYLSGITDEIDPACYVYTDSSATEVEPISYSDLLTLTGGVDPFTIPDGSSSTSGDPTVAAELNALAEALFAYGFQATMGLPSTTPPDIITLQAGTQYQQVKYNIYFKTFNIVQLVPGFGSFSLTNLVQDPNAPWIYEYTVNLNLQSADFDSLDQATQDQIMNLDSASMFSVQQLLLDLSVAPVISADPPDVYTEFDANPEFQSYLQGYFDSLRRNDATVFAQAVQPTDSSPNANEPSLIPTALDFMVSRYSTDPSDGNLTEEQTQGLWTLNYLIMADGHSLPNPLMDPSPSWNWLNANDDEQYDGIMSIRKGEFVGYLESTLNGALYDVCVYPDIKINSNNNLETDTWYHGDASYSTINTNTNNTNSNVLTATYSSPTMSDEADSGWYKAEVSTQTVSNVYISDNTIRIDTQITAYTTFYAGYFGGDSSLSKTHGYVYATLNTVVYQLGVTTNGLLQVTKDDSQSGNTNLLGTSGYGEPDPSFWSDLLSGWNEEGWATDLSSYLDTAFSEYLSSYDSHLTNLLNNVNAWAFPGADTFTYSKCQFSDYQDLTSAVKYTDVS